VSIPSALPVRAVRRIFCAHCERLCEAAAVSEVRPGFGERIRSMIPSLPAVSLPSVSLPAPAERFGVDTRWLTLPIAAIAVFAVLSLLNGDDSPAPAPAPTAAAAKPDRAPADAKSDAKAHKANAPEKAAVPADAQLVAESTFSLALPAGWDRVNPAAGATFAAVSSDGTADATLWIQENPKLDFATFEASSLQQLETLAGSARVVERSVGPSVQASSITLAPKNVPEGAPTYEVVLRGSGDNWYYLATTYQASAPADAIAGVDIIQGSFLPIGGKG
jgi:pyruvate/2-oxoglutarate dehydrogenase complex dihydrolipoamide acyltransferase (E2) component